MKLISFLVAGLAAMFACASARADLVTNGGFETGDFTGWTTSGNGLAIDSVFPDAGNFDASFSAFSSDPNPGVLSQSIATNAGQSYVLKFSLLDEAGFAGDLFNVSFGGLSQTITGDQAAPFLHGSLYTLETFVVPAADIVGSSTMLAFEGEITPGIASAWNLDTVSIVPFTAVPETPTLFVLGMALLLSAPIGARRAKWRRVC
jgi:hypothetical protein